MLVTYAMERFHQKFPPEVVETAKLSIYDSLGCMIIGSQDTCFFKLKRYLKEYGGQAVCSVISADGFKTDMEHAASLNAMAAHIRDYDDMCAVLHGHATSAVFSTVLAVGERLHKSGTDLLQAFVTGADVAALMGRGLVADGYPHACDSSSTLSIFGSAIAAGVLMGLTEKQLVNAFGIAASEAAGLRANYGTLAKDLTAARTAARGIYAANMAKLNFDANPNIIEDPNGFLAACSSTINIDAMKQVMKAKSSIFERTGMRVKNYPTCGGTHCAMDAAIHLKKQYGIAFQDVEHIYCVAQSSTKASDKYPVPANPMQGKFSIAYCISVALYYGYGYIGAFCGEEFPAEELMELVQKTEVALDDGIFEDALEGAQVTIILKDGRKVRDKVDYCTGSLGKELSEEQRIDKFSKCVSGIMPQGSAHHYFDRTQNLEQCQDIGKLMEEIQISMSTQK
ncbi:MAG: MmgE/PrpD family protein [Lachnospiraceae bacterium]|nr:MmgE/PrpD family protein [Lachnospiraceae bacterium]